MSCFLHSRIWATLWWEKAWCLWKPWSSTSGMQYELVQDKLLNSQIPKISRYIGKWAWLLIFSNCSSLSSCLAWFNLTVRVSHGFGWDPNGSAESRVWILAFFTECSAVPMEHESSVSPLSSHPASPNGVPWAAPAPELCLCQPVQSHQVAKCSVGCCRGNWRVLLGVMAAGSRKGIFCSLASHCLSERGF